MSCAAQYALCKKGHPLSGENILRRKDGVRRCKTCVEDYEAARCAKRQAAAEIRKQQPKAKRQSSHCKNGHEFTAENTIALKGAQTGHRRCRFCTQSVQRNAVPRRSADAPQLSISDLHDLLSYDASSGFLFWKPREISWFKSKGSRLAAMASWNAKYAGKRADTVKDEKGYPMVIILRRRMFAHRIAFALHHGHWPEPFTDHIDGDRANNSIDNLRQVDRFDNAKNLGVPRQNKSGVVGVFWRERFQRWVASIRDGRRQIFLGHFLEKEDAVAARKAAEIQYGFHENHGQRPAFALTPKS